MAFSSVKFVNKHFGLIFFFLLLFFFFLLLYSSYYFSFSSSSVIVDCCCCCVLSPLTLFFLPLIYPLLPWSVPSQSLLSLLSLPLSPHPPLSLPCSSLRFPKFINRITINFKKYNY